MSRLEPRRTWFGAEAMVDAKLDRTLREAIQTKRLLRFKYKDQERVAEPHDYGIQNGRVRLLVYQFAGRSNSGRLPAWRLVDIAGMTEIEVLETTFRGYRPPPSGQHHKWDQIFIGVGEVKN